MIIGISGKAGTGKDTVAEHLETWHSYVHTKFAEALKNCVKAAFNLTDAETLERNKEKENEYWGVSYRKMLQFVGTELFREHMDKLLYEEGKSLQPKHFWIHSLEKRIKYLESRTESPNLHICISDVRFQNEHDWVIRNGGILIRINRLQYKKNPGIESHSSEELPDLSLYPKERTYELENNGEIKDLTEQIDAIVFKL